MCTPTCASPLTKKGHERYEKILEAAGEVFAEQGFADASINEIGKRAGGSLGTIYKFFGNKLGLFEAYFQKATCEVFSQFHAEDFWTDDLEESLYKFGSALQSLILKPEAISIYRLVLAEQSAEQADIQKVFLENGPEMINKYLADFLRKQEAKGLIKVADVDIASYQFVDLIKGPMHFYAIFGREVDKEICQKTLDQAVEVFLRGIAQ